MNNIDKKNQRKYLILGHLIDEYVSTASPVSSKVIAKSMESSVSSATARNIMAELEDEGYIVQPHTSAGRIPTNLGYRRYVDRVRADLMSRRNAAKRLAKEYDDRIRTIKDILDKTSFLLSRELHNAGVVLWPSMNDFHLKHIEFIKVRSETILAILVTVTNAVRNYIVKLDQEIENIDLEKVSNYINSNHSHVSFLKILDDLKNGSGNTASRSEKEVEKNAADIMNAISDQSFEDEISYKGLDHFMDEPEFRDRELTKSLLNIFSEKSDIMGLMRAELPFRGIKVYIGEENDCEKFAKCTVITCGYTLHDKTVGRIGIIGPTRMNYVRALSTVDHLADLVSLKLNEIEEC